MPQSQTLEAKRPITAVDRSSLCHSCLHTYSPALIGSSNDEHAALYRHDRLFAITLMLQVKGCLRAKDLAAWFEVGERTIYRDIAAISESGVPIVSLPGEGYELMEGFFLPPLLFTRAEASALFARKSSSSPRY